MTLFAQSEALFGSACRGDADQLSDRDILIVDADSSILRRRRTDLENSGYSVATYTWGKLRSLAEQQVLFLQHLKSESHILRDDRNQLRELLFNFRPKTCYSVELRKNSELASVALEYPSTPRGVLWAADVMYVCARNFGILKLAENGKYVFSAADISSALIEMGILQTNHRQVLSRLRRLKSLYRTGALNLDEAVENTLKAALEAFPEIISLLPAAIKPMNILRGITSQGSDVSAYHRLRNLEKIYLSIEALDLEFARTENFIRLRRWIEDPRQYASFATRNEIDLIEQVKLYSARIDADEISCGILAKSANAVHSRSAQ